MIRLAWEFEFCSQACSEAESEEAESEEAESEELPCMMGRSLWEAMLVLEQLEKLEDLQTLVLEQFEKPGDLG